MPICNAKTCFTIVRDCEIILDHMMKETDVENKQNGKIALYHDATLSKSFSVFLNENNSKIYISDVKVIKINEDGTVWEENYKIGKRWLILDVRKDHWRH